MLGLSSILILLIAILYTYPLIFNLSFMFPGSGESDTTLSPWNIWHLKKTIFTTHNFFAFNTKYIFFPQTPSLALHNYTLTVGLMSLPLQLFFDPIVSRNIIFFLEFILTGLGIYLLISYFTNNKIAALWSSLTLAFCPYVIVNSYNFLHFSGIWFFPWFLYMLWLFIDTARLRFGCGAAIVYALCLLNDQTYFIFLTILMLFMCPFFFSVKNRPSLKVYLRSSLTGIAIFLILTLPYLIALLGQIMKGKSGFSIWPDATIGYFSLHLGDLFTPPTTLSLYQPGLCPCLPVDRITNVFVGYVPLFFAIFALLNINNVLPNTRRMIIYCLITGIVFFLLALGPLPFENSNWLNRFSPYNYLCRSALLRQLRIPVRFSIVSIMAIYILAAFGVDRFIKLNKEKLVGKATLGLFLIILPVIEFLPIPYPLLNLEVPKIYYNLARIDINEPILVLPLGWQSSYRTVGDYHKKIQFYQTVHAHPLFQGQIARIDDSYLNYYTEQKGFRYLMDAALRLPRPEEEKEVHNLIHKYGIKYVIIHRAYFNKAHFDALVKIFKDYQGEILIGFAP